MSNVVGLIASDILHGWACVGLLAVCSLSHDLYVCMVSFVHLQCQNPCNAESQGPHQVAPLVWYQCNAHQVGSEYERDAESQGPHQLCTPRTSKDQTLLSRIEAAFDESIAEAELELSKVMSAHGWLKDF
jgi:hypothetical protein